MNREQVWRHVIDALGSVPGMHPEDVGHGADAVMAFLDTLVDDTIEARVRAVYVRWMERADVLDWLAEQRRAAAHDDEITRDLEHGAATLRRHAHDLADALADAPPADAPPADAAA